jgi:DNA-binding NarL/FixJ family response regulator
VISLKVVVPHVTIIFTKIDVSNRTEAAGNAMRQNLVL